MLEDGLRLLGEIVSHELLLASAIPEIEGQVPEEPNIAFGDIDGVTDPHCLISWVICEYNRVHGSLSRAISPHQQQLKG